MNNPSAINDIRINILDNNELLTWIKKWDIYPFQFMEAYHSVKEKTIYQIEEYLKAKGLIKNQ